MCDGTTRAATMECVNEYRLIDFIATRAIKIVSIGQSLWFIIINVRKYLRPAANKIAKYQKKKRCKCC